MARRNEIPVSWLIAVVFCALQETLLVNRYQHHRGHRLRAVKHCHREIGAVSPKVESIVSNAFRDALYRPNKCPMNLTILQMRSCRRYFLAIWPVVCGLAASWAQNASQNEDFFVKSVADGEVVLTIRQKCRCYREHCFCCRRR